MRAISPIIKLICMLDCPTFDGFCIEYLTHCMMKIEWVDNFSTGLKFNVTVWALRLVNAPISV